MRRRTGSFLTVIALLLVLWFIVSRLRFVVFVSIPWWGFLILALILFLAVDYVLDRLFNRAP